MDADTGQNFRPKQIQKNVWAGQEGSREARRGRQADSMNQPAAAHTLVSKLLWEQNDTCLPSWGFWMGAERDHPPSRCPGPVSRQGQGRAGRWW